MELSRALQAKADALQKADRLEAELATSQAQIAELMEQCTAALARAEAAELQCTEAVTRADAAEASCKEAVLRAERAEAECARAKQGVQAGGA